MDLQKPQKEFPEKNTRTKRKRSGRNNRLLLVLSVFALLVLLLFAFLIARMLLPNRERVDRAAYFGLSDANAWGLIINGERVSRSPVNIGGSWYLDLDTVTESVTGKFYFDGEKLLYTDPTTTYTAVPGELLFSDDEGLRYAPDYVPCYLEEGQLYIALEYIRRLNFSYYLTDPELKYAWIYNDWSERTAYTLEKAGALRPAAGIREPVVEDLEAGETLILMEEGAKWDIVQSAESGLIGCIQKDRLSEAANYRTEIPDRRTLPEYTTAQLGKKVCMAWHQVFTESGYGQLDQYLEQADGLNVLAPTWITLKDESGEISSLAELRYVRKAHRAGVKVWVMVNDIDNPVDDGALLSDTASRQALTANIIREVLRVEADGVNLDFERVSSENADDFLQFVRELSAGCRKNGLTFSIDNYSPMPHTAFYDRAQQGEMIDYVIVMAYDEHYVGGATAGSTASVGWVRQSAERTLEEVPEEKLIIGLPFYTRVWKETAEGSLTSEGVGMDACTKIVEERKLTPVWLDEEQQYYVEYGEPNVFYRLWIEDERSMGVKLDAAFSYNPAGVAFFKIGLDSSAVWSVIKPYFGGD